MKLLLDESIPRQLTSVFPFPFRPYTVQQMSWAGISNGKLLQLATEHGFCALITIDQGFEYQQNITKLPIPVLILHATPARLPELSPLIPRVVSILLSDPECQLYKISDHGYVD